MKSAPDCAICGHGVEEYRATVTVEWREEHPDEYTLHEQCARAVFNGWRHP